ncbi:MAG: glycosyltransferase family 2 protein [Candidatus Delongbacteria bacterium]|jgi:glycosyltransferase involved in cell wall biosynthesis|nr:glycosyltransferase family 2 protein [Candidatus Delongbacteria bacterium]
MLKNKSIAVVIPALNEEVKIKSVIQSIPDFVDKVFVVNDGSTDNTAKVASEAHAIVISHKENRGVGLAFKTGVEAVLNGDFDVMVNMDGDGQFNPEDIVKLVDPIVNDEADFVTASRFKDNALIPDMPKAKLWGNKNMSRFISWMTKQKFYDVSCGFRAYNRLALLKLNLFGDFTYTQESFIDLAFKNVRIMEIPVEVRGVREHGKSRVASNLFRYAVQTFKIILRTYRDYKPLRLFGYFALFSFIITLILGGFFIVHYINTGYFSPHKWAGFVSGFFFVVSLVLVMMGFILDMFARMRQNQEKILYELKKDK